ncbi:MAG: hypothetical protein MHM6MM_003926 [Cercozoa sp. M6MM]
MWVSPTSRCFMIYIGWWGSKLGCLMGSLQVEESRVRFGANVVPPPPLRSFLSFCMEQLEDKILLLLIVCAVVQIPLGVFLSSEDEELGWLDGVVILIAVSIVVLTGAGTDYQKQKKFAELSAVADNIDVFVKRACAPEPFLVNLKEIVVGDVIVLRQGNALVADGVCINSSELKANESSLTGEPDLLKKEPHNSLLISGTTIGAGSGSMLALAVGTRTFSTRLKSKLEAQDPPPTQLQMKLEHLAALISWFGLGAAIVSMFVLFVRFFAAYDGWEDDDASELLSYVVTAITILVVAVPEGLPLAVVLSLAFSVKKMMKDNNLVRNLHKCETMGGATTICSDKTGTLTENKMSVRAAFLANTYFPTPKHAVEKDGAPSAAVRDLLLQSLVVNTSPTSQLTQGEDGRPVRSGNPTECAFLELLDKGGVDYEAIRQEAKPHVIRELPFDSAIKRMSVVVEMEDCIRVLTKGAPEIVYARCVQALMTDKAESCDDPNALDEFEAARADLRDRQKQFSDQAYRVLAFAFKDLPKDEATRNMVLECDEEELVRELTCVGIAGIADPLREDVPDAIQVCRTAGIKVRMVTGDNIDTAKAIARDAGIYDSTHHELAMEGPEFRSFVEWREWREEDPDTGKVVTQQTFNQEKFNEIGGKLTVLARSSPNDKFVLVSGLQAMGEVVAVTGDGTNDSLALRKADVGFSMGIAGTEVAKQASDIVILDDNFASIVQAVKWGRNVLDSIKKFLQFQLTVNVVAIFVAALGAIVLGRSPLTTVQLLWVNLVMDAFASLALATEPPSDELLQRHPARQVSLISRLMMRNIFGQALLQCVVLLTLIFAGEKIFDVPDGRAGGHSAVSLHFTVVFNVFVLMQLFNLVNARLLNNDMNPFQDFFHNPLYTIIFVACFAAQFLIVEFGGAPVRVVSLITHEDAKWWHWLACLGLGALSLPMGLLLRLIDVEKIEAIPEIDAAEYTMEESAASLFHILRRPAANPKTAKFRKAGMAVIAANRMKRAAGDAEAEAAPGDPEAEDMPLTQGIAVHEEA